MTASAFRDPELLSCAIAGGYAGRWARAQVRRADAEREAMEPSSAWFVDAFAGADLQRAALRGAAVEAGGLASVRAMVDAVDQTRIVLADEDPGLLLRLEEELDRLGMGDRVRRTRDASSIEAGEIGLLESSFAAISGGLVDAMGDAAALVRLAPLSARSLPWTALQPIASRARTELLLRFPAEDFHKQARVTGPIADFPPNIRRLVEGCSALLGDGRHGWLAAWRDAMRRDGADAALAAVVDRYRELLAGAGEERIVRVQRLEGAAGPVHLLLATSDPAHVLELNGAIVDGGVDLLPPAITAAEPGPEAGAEEADEAPPAALDLFPVPPPPAAPKPRGPALRAVADELHARHRGSLVAYPHLLATLADSGLTSEQVREALAILKRAGRAAYRSLDAADAEV
ncbi:MAG TPA: hypothetical protein VEY93_02595, partial [Longimicrobium sp.]|nr:hypothetical protein [Longimicrobium sp.]